MTYGSLFAGIGGIDLGMDAAGFECRWQVEKDEDCCKVLAKHWPNVKRYGDITQIETDELERVDAIVGGFPCQDLSQAGKRKGFHHEDGTATRSGLWFEFARIVGALRPRYVLAENVPGLLTQPGAMGAVLGELARLGYVGSWRCLRASEFGASHLRKRVFIVAYSMRKGSSPVEDFQPHQRARPDDSVSAPGRKLADSSEGSGTGIDQSAGNGREDSGGGSGQLADAEQQSRRAEQFDGAREREDCAAFHGSVLGVESAGDGLADGPSGGRGELRDSPRRDGQLDGSGEVLADTERPRSGRGFRESHTQQNGDGTEGGGSELANAECSERWTHIEHEQPEGRRQQEAGGIAGDSTAMADPGSGQLSEPWRGSEGRAGLGSAGAVLPDLYRISCNCGYTFVGILADPCPGCRRHQSGHTNEVQPSDQRGAIITTDWDGDDVPDTSIARLPDAEQSELPGTQRHEERRTVTELCGAFAPGPNDPRWATILAERPDLAPALESPVRGVAHGLPDWMDRAMSRRTKRLSRLGNAVVWQCAYWMAMGIRAHAESIRNGGGAA